MAVRKIEHYPKRKKGVRKMTKGSIEEMAILAAEKDSK